MKKISIAFVAGWLVCANSCRQALVGENLIQGAVNYVKERVR